MIELRTENFKQEIDQGVVVVDFWAPWCGSCMQMLPILEEVEKERTEVKFTKVNSSDHMDVAKEFGVMSLPTVVVLKNGNEVGRINGFLPKENLVAQIDSFIK